jgi:hypothetical protein
MLKTIKIDTLELDPRLQWRDALCEEHVETMAEHLAEPGYHLPAIEIVKGEKDWVWNGFHRIAAYKKAGRKEIPVKITDGDFQKARKLSYGANGDNGLPRRRDEVARLVQSALKEFPEMSDSEISKLCGVHHTTVGRARKKLSCAVAQDAPATRTVTRNGKTYPMQVGNIGKAQPKPDPVPGWDDEPEGIRPDPPPANRLPDPPAKPQPASNGTHHANGVLRVGDKPRPNPDADDLPTMPKVEPMDSLGNPVSKTLRDTFAGNTQALENGIRLLQEVRRTVKGLEAWNAWMRPAEMESKLDELIEDFKNGLPYAVCDDCKGKGCSQCRKEGWLTKWRYEEMANA